LFKKLYLDSIRSEGTELEVMTSLQQFVPFCKFEVHPIASESQVNEMIKALTG